MEPYIYLRGLRRAEHTVFCVDDGQKTYYDPQFNKVVAYSSGQQVKRSILDALTSQLNVKNAPITFNYNINKKNGLENKEPWSPADPSYVDQLIGGWMRADGENPTVKRRSPLSISAMRPLHPYLAGTVREIISFDRSDEPDHHPVRVMMAGRDEPLSEEEIQEFLDEHNRTLPRRNWIPENTRTTGLFIYDVAIDLRTLFSVSMNQHERALTKDKIEKLKEDGWIEGENVFGQCLIMPEEERDKVIPAFAHALINWRITSNQSRTFSLMEPLAVAVSQNANRIAGSIRAKLDPDSDFMKAKPIIEELDDADLYVTLSCGGYVPVNNESADALEKAEEKLVELMRSFEYENQTG